MFSTEKQKSYHRIISLSPYHISWSFFPTKTIKKDLDPSDKTDLDVWDCLGRAKCIL